jgi:hypothetical protein
MTPSISFLLEKKLGRPSSVYENKGDWGTAERRIGCALPPDYKEFIETYGTGVIGGWLTVLNPFSKSPKANLITANEEMRVEYADRERDGIAVPFATLPFPGGLLLWGRGNTGDDLHWLTARAPDQWSVAVCRLRDGENYAFCHSMSDFMVRLINNGLSPRAISPKVFVGAPKFLPDRNPLG